MEYEVRSISSFVFHVRKRGEESRLTISPFPYSPGAGSVSSMWTHVDDEFNEEENNLHELRDKSRN